MIGPCYVIQYVVSFLVLQSSHWGKELIALFYYLLGRCGCYCSLSLPQGDLGLQCDILAFHFLILFAFFLVLRCSALFFSFAGLTD